MTHSWSVETPQHSENVRPEQVDKAIRLSRSPHPYHRRGSSALFTRPDVLQTSLPSTNGSRSNRAITSSSDSGTEADDEKGSIARGLPAPPFRLRKGLKGNSPYQQSPVVTPFPPAEPRANEKWNEYFSTPNTHEGREQRDERCDDIEGRRYAEARRKEILRRSTETLLVCLLTGCLVYQNSQTRWWLELRVFGGTLTTIYLVHFLWWTTRRPKAVNNRSTSRFRFQAPLRFDPGPLLYPVLLPLSIALALSARGDVYLLPDLILGLASVPDPVIHSFYREQTLSTVLWILCMAPVSTYQLFGSTPSAMKSIVSPSISSETLSLLYPLHHFLTGFIRFIVTTSLDPVEVELLATGLINLLLFATSPPMVILKALLWLGGLCFSLTASSLLQWELTIARIPISKLRRNTAPSRGFLARLDYYLCEIIMQGFKKLSSTHDPDEEEAAAPYGLRKTLNQALRQLTRTSMLPRKSASLPNRDPVDARRDQEAPQEQSYTSHSQSKTQTQSVIRGTQRRKLRSSQTTTRSRFLLLSPAQIKLRKWMYAIAVYSITIVIITVPVRVYIQREALDSHEPFGWALGYLLGDIPSFRFFTVYHNLERWISLPTRDVTHAFRTDEVERTYPLNFNLLRGAAERRLAICAYCILVLSLGLFAVIRVTSFVEVDTRRKIFHGTIVAMLLPSIFVDPCFISLALALILSIFILLDLYRAAQLPPISRPLTHFLAPYIDGRDHRGPVIVSPMFLLIGCAIPLWLTLAGTQRTGQVPWRGWDVPHSARSLSMVSGLVCVGMGDAAASLIGRRYGKTKWYWGGGKSLEGSAAFSLAVAVGLFASWIWLQVGGWVVLDSVSDEGRYAMVGVVVGKCVLAGLGASLMEATLTSANDNVVVPIGLWLMVRILDI